MASGLEATGESSPRVRLWHRLPLGVLREEPQFAKLWGATSISLVGTAITGLALPLAAVIALRASPFEVGALEACQWLPWLLIGLSAGVWVDRLPRRRVMLASDFVSATLLTIVPAAWALGILRMGILFVVAAGVGTASVFTNAASPAFVPTVVAQKRLLEANSLMRLSQSLAFTAGPGIGGWLVQILTAPVAILADCVSYLVSAMLLSRIEIEESAPPKPEGAPSHHQEIVRGLRLVLRNRVLRPMVIATSIGNFANGVWNAVIVIFLIRTLGIQPAYIGLPLVAMGIVGMLSALLAPIAAYKLGFGRAVLVSSLAGNAPMLAVPFLSRGSTGLLGVVAAFMVAGAFAPLFNACTQSLIQVSAPERALGRVNATMNVLSWGLMPIGALIGGALAGPIGVRGALFVGASLWLCSVGAIVLSPIPFLRELPGSPGGESRPGEAANPHVTGGIA
jgi:predicted MFS family arabinose efflux permease